MTERGAVFVVMLMTQILLGGMDLADGRWRTGVALVLTAAINLLVLK